MGYCEDFPSCGHESGCCPDFDPETGEQLNMKCICGAALPVNSRFSLCETCLKMDDDENGAFGYPLTDDFSSYPFDDEDDGDLWNDYG